MKPHPSRGRNLLTFVVVAGLMLGALVFSIALRAAPASPAVNAAAAANGAVPLTDEPEEYADVSGGGFATGHLGSGGKKCPPPPPGGSLVFSGGKIMFYNKVFNSLVIGGGASRKEFAWIAEKARPPMSWTCGGGGQFRIGDVYGVAVSFHGATKPCGASTTVSLPAFVDSGGGIYVPSDEKGSGAIYFPKIKTVTAATAKSNPNRWRKKIGVGEIVSCNLAGAPAGCTAIEWIVTGAGGCTIQGDGGYGALFEAGDQAGGATVTVIFAKSNPPRFPGSLR